MSEKRGLNKRDKEIAELSRAAQTLRLPISVQHEKLETIFHLDENPFEEQHNGFSTPEFRSVKIGYVDKLFQKVQGHLKSLFSSYAAFEIGWSRFYQLLR